MYEGTVLEKIWKIIYPILIYFGIRFIIQTAAQSIIGTRLLFELNESVGSGVYASTEYADRVQETANYYSPVISSVALLIILVVLLIVAKRTNSLPAEGGNVRGIIKNNIISLLALGFFTSTGASRLVSLFFYSSSLNNYDSVEASLLSGNPVMVFISSAVLAPIVEELIFRGFIYNRLKGYISVIAATVISAAMFGAYHLNLTQGIYACFLGLALAFVYEKFGTLLAPIIFHITANVIALVLTWTGISERISRFIPLYIALMLAELIVASFIIYRISKKALEK